MVSNDSWLVTGLWLEGGDGRFTDVVNDFLLARVFEDVTDSWSMDGFSVGTSNSSKKGGPVGEFTDSRWVWGVVEVLVTFWTAGWMVGSK